MVMVVVVVMLCHFYCQFLKPYFSLPVFQFKEKTFHHQVPQLCFFPGDLASVLSWYQLAIPSHKGWVGGGRDGGKQQHFTKNTAYDTFENFNYQVVEDLFGDRCEFWKNIYEQFYQVNIFFWASCTCKKIFSSIIEVQSRDGKPHDGGKGGGPIDGGGGLRIPRRR